MPAAKMRRNGQVIIPIAVREALGLVPGDQVQFVAAEAGRFEIAAQSRRVKELRGMFGPARRRVSVEEMNPAFVERLPADDSSRNQVPAARQKKRPTSKNAAAALQEGLADPKPRPTVSKSVVDGRIVYGSLVTPKHVTRAQIAEAVKSVKKVKSKDASAS